jgi:hypothetical protein
VGYIQPDSQGDHRSIDDSNTLAQVEHALPAHRRIEQPRDRLPGHPPRWMAVESSRQPRSPFTLARGLRTLRHRDAGRVTFSFGSRTDPSRQATKRPIEVGRRSRPSPCARTRPTNAAELASHDRNRGPLRRRYRTGLAPLPRVQPHGSRPEGRESLPANGRRGPRRPPPPTPTEMSASTTAWLGSEGPPLPRVSRAKSVPSPERSLEQSARCRHRETSPHGDAIRDRKPRLEARTCCVQLPLNDRRRPLRQRQMRG